MEVTIYHNPRCSKSRQTLALLEEKGISPRVVEYLKTPPTEPELAAILAMLNLEPEALMRKQEAEYKQAGLDEAQLSRAEKSSAW